MPRRVDLSGKLDWQPGKTGLVVLSFHQEPHMQPKPTKEAVRLFLVGRAKQKAPVPSIEEIRRQLGFGLVADRSR